MQETHLSQFLLPFPSQVQPEQPVPQAQVSFDLRDSSSGMD
jgi:hypothetical protein